MARKSKVAKPEEIDHDMENWVRLGSGVTEPDEGLTEGQRITVAGNAWARAQLAPRRWRQDGARVNPFIQPFL
jgi:hypothetical protein